MFAVLPAAAAMSYAVACFTETHGRSKTHMCTHCRHLTQATYAHHFIHQGDNYKVLIRFMTPSFEHNLLSKPITK